MAAIMTLLEKAKAANAEGQSGRKYSQEEFLERFELAWAWYSKEITMKQAASVLGKNIDPILRSILWTAEKRGLVKLVRVSNSK